MFPMSHKHILHELRRRTSQHHAEVWLQSSAYPDGWPDSAKQPGLERIETHTARGLQHHAIGNRAGPEMGL